MVLFLWRKRWDSPSAALRLHTDGSATQFLANSVPASPLFAKNSSPDCFLNAQTLSGSHRTLLTAKAKNRPKAAFALAEAVGFEPTSP